MALKEEQHMFLPEDSTPEEIMICCDSHLKIHNGKVLMCITKGTHEFKEAEALASQQLK